MSCWLQICRWPVHEAVHHIRLHCVPELQRALDARFSDSQWSILSTEEALSAIEKLVLRASNRAAQWYEFFNLAQGLDESISDFFLRCNQKALDCEFECPNCSVDLTEYFLLRKVMVSLSDVKLKGHIFQSCDKIRSVDALRATCSAFQAARQNLGGEEKRFNVSLAAGTVAERTLEREEGSGSSNDVTVGRVQHSGMTNTSCGNCGGRHAPGKGLCPAKALTCHFCKKVGHLKRYCRSARKKGNSDEAAGLITSGAVTIANVGNSNQPSIQVLVMHGGREVPCKAVPDTGAQVCVAGVELRSCLGVPALLQRQAGIGLRDVANLQLKCVGAAMVTISHKGLSTRQKVYFVDSAKNFYLSLSACKELGVVHRNFPQQVPVVGVVSSVDPPPATDCTVMPRPLPPKPEVMPFQPIEENVHRLEGWLLQHFSSSTFDTSREPLPVMVGKPHHIHLLSDAVPIACHTPVSIPRHWEDEVKRQLEEDVSKGVIEPVPAGEATEWCSRMVVVAKKSGQPRRTVDFQKLNACCLRETHHTPAPFDMVSGVPAHSFKTTADAHWGYHQVELDQESRRLTTFITPWGRYRYRRTPMGHCAAGDAYTKRFDDAIQDIPRKLKCIDDTLLYDTCVEEAFWHTYEFLETCATKGITLKPEKFRFCRKEVDFVGFHLGWDEYKPTRERLAAIMDFSMPDNPTLTDIRSWHGFINQLAPFLATAPIMEPFRELLKKSHSKQVYWDDQLQQTFKKAQDIICQLARDGLSYFDKSRPTAAITDWSREGVGFIILQQYCKCTSVDTPFCCKGGWRIALCGSRCVTTAEAGYAAVEGEMLAVVWCLKKARLFLLGCPNLIVVTDHRPLVKLLGDRALGDISNPRLFRLKEKTLQFRFQVKYLPGKKNSAADFLSRYPLIRNQPNTSDVELEDELSAAVIAAVTEAVNYEGKVMDEGVLRQAAVQDPVYQLLVARVLAGDWCAQRSQELACLRPFYSVRDRLAVTEDLVTYTFDQGCVRLVVPESLRQQVATNLHAGHQGTDSMFRRARQSVYWPGMEGDLQHVRMSCPSCETHTPSQPQESMIMATPPEYPFQRTVADLFQSDGQMYLAYADRLTGWLEIAHFPNGTTSSKIASVLRTYFTRWGSPEQLSTDGGTNLVSEEMVKFFETWGVKIRLSSAHYPQSNGRAEAAVKTAKRLIRNNIGQGGSLDCDKASMALLQYLNTPLRDIEKSPAQLATGRQLRDGVPTARSHFRVSGHWQNMLRERERKMSEKHEQIRVENTSRSHTPLQTGTPVRAQNPSTKAWDRTGVVTEALPHRQYTVRLDGSGRVTLRNRIHLRVNTNRKPTPPPTPILTRVSSPRPSPTPTRAHTPTPMLTPEPVQPSTPTPGPPPTERPSGTYAQDVISPVPVSPRPKRALRKPQWLLDYNCDFSP